MELEFLPNILSMTNQQAFALLRQDFLTKITKVQRTQRKIKGFCSLSCFKN